MCRPLSDFVKMASRSVSPVMMALAAVIVLCVATWPGVDAQSTQCPARRLTSILSARNNHLNKHSIHRRHSKYSVTTQTSQLNSFRNWFKQAPMKGSSEVVRPPQTTTPTWLTSRPSFGMVMQQLVVEPLSANAGF